MWVLFFVLGGFSVLSYFLELSDAPGLSRIFPALVLKSAIFQEDWFLLLENDFRNQDLGAECVHCYWGVITSRTPQLAEQGNICVYILCMYM